MPEGRSLRLTQCGVTMTLGICSSGLSLGVGSTSVTSSPAAQISPCSSAAISAASSVTGPLRIQQRSTLGV